MSRESDDAAETARLAEAAKLDDMFILNQRLDRAERALKRAGYEDRGGEEWVPPLGKMPEHLDDDLKITLRVDRADSAELQVMNMLLQLVSLEHTPLNYHAKVRAAEWLLAKVRDEPWECSNAA